jgi:iron complex outermembrane receptor protein
MKSLYSSSSGNPDLLEEAGRSLELGIDYQGPVILSAAVFYNVFTDLIQSYRGLDGYRNYQNIGKAVIRGFEIQAGKKWDLLDVQAAYTYLDSEEKDLGMPLDYTPRHQISVFVTLGRIRGFSLSLWGKGVSDSYARMGKEPPFELLTIPSYFLLNATLEKALGVHSVYLKVSNVLDAMYFSEPGFPATDRRISIGVNLRVQ